MLLIIFAEKTMMSIRMADARLYPGMQDLAAGNGSRHGRRESAVLGGDMMNRSPHGAAGTSLLPDLDLCLAVAGRS
ncbi:hypothetical protein T190_20830 [Sinorhizobium meliloti CCBAU 01290]|nr:hypothetical protein T190_20830 [Sinorhizobium meliloti CCBAU 01290]